MNRLVVEMCSRHSGHILGRIQSCKLGFLGVFICPWSVPPTPPTPGSKWLLQISTLAFSWLWEDIPKVECIEVTHLKSSVFIPLRGRESINLTPVASWLEGRGNHSNCNTPTWYLWAFPVFSYNIKLSVSCPLSHSIQHTLLQPALAIV